MYKDARKGTAEIIDKPMKLYDFEVLDYRFPLLKLRCDVGSGTYIRSIGYRLGKELGLGGALVELKRIRVGEWFLSELSEEHLAKGNIKGEMRKIFYKEVFLD